MTDRVIDNYADAFRHLENLARQATPGPWHASMPPSVFAGNENIVVGNCPSYYPPESPRGREARANAEYLGACAPEIILALIAAARTRIEDVKV